jgi:hypothetical protein
MMPWTWHFWRLARGNDDGTTIIDASGEWIRLFGRTWWLMERAR